LDPLNERAHDRRSCGVSQARQLFEVLFGVNGIRRPAAWRANEKRAFNGLGDFNQGRNGGMDLRDYR
jgi:hypothetical protein